MANERRLATTPTAATLVATAAVSTRASPPIARTRVGHHGAVARGGDECDTTTTTASTPRATAHVAVASATGRATARHPWTRTSDTSDGSATIAAATTTTRPTAAATWAAATATVGTVRAVVGVTTSQCSMNFANAAPPSTKPPPRTQHEQPARHDPPGWVDPRAREPRRVRALAEPLDGHRDRSARRHRPLAVGVVEQRLELVAVALAPRRGVPARGAVATGRGHAVPPATRPSRAYPTSLTWRSRTASASAADPRP